MVTSNPDYNKGFINGLNEARAQIVKIRSYSDIETFSALDDLDNTLSKKIKEWSIKL